MYIVISLYTYTHMYIYIYIYIWNESIALLRRGGQLRGAHVDQLGLQRDQPGSGKRRISYSIVCVVIV